MILFKKEEFQGNEEKFRITTSHKNTWANYTDQYQNLLLNLNQTALKLNYQLNIKSYPYLFLLRHFCELKLKSILEQRQIEIPHKHEFGLLFDLLPDVPEELKMALDVINLDEDGSCYRYMYDKYGELTPLYKIEKKILPFYEEQVGIPLTSLYNMTLGIVPPFKKMLPWELTFHFNEISNSSQLRSTYDEVTDYVLQKVISGELDINHVYLPLLFLIRHSVELALKESLLELIHTQDEVFAKRIRRLISNEHKLSDLLKIYLKILPQDVSGLPEHLHQQYEDFLKQTERLKASLHQLDTNSRYFRYPHDLVTEHHLRLPADALLSIIPDFLEADAFLTFNVDLLKECNIVSYSNEEMERMMGFDPMI